MLSSVVLVLVVVVVVIVVVAAAVVLVVVVLVPNSDCASLGKVTVEGLLKATLTFRDPSSLLTEEDVVMCAAWKLLVRWSSCLVFEVVEAVLRGGGGCAEELALWRMQSKRGPSVDELSSPKSVASFWRPGYVSSCSEKL